MTEIVGDVLNLLFLKKFLFFKKCTEYMVEHVFWDVNNAYYDRHMYIAWHDARCACFLVLSASTNIVLRVARQIRWKQWSCTKKKHRCRSLVHRLLECTSPPSCTCMVVETQEAAIQSVRSPTCNSSFHCSPTTVWLGPSCDKLRRKKKGLGMMHVLMTIIYIYIYIYIYIWHCQY